MEFSRWQSAATPPVECGHEIQAPNGAGDYLLRPGLNRVMCCAPLGSLLHICAKGRGSLMNEGNERPGADDAVRAERYGISKGTLDRVSFPAQSSVLDEDSLAQRVVPLYELPRLATCRFLTRGDSDVYVLSITDGRRCYLKIYRPPHSLKQAEAEGRLTADLAAVGFPAVEPIRRRDGAYATLVQANEGPRPILVWAEAPAGPTETTPALMEQSGRVVANLHRVADTLSDAYELPIAGAESFRSLLPCLLARLSRADARFIDSLANWAYVRASEWTMSAPDFGICHGDLVPGNRRTHPVCGVSLFDFGAACYSWRVRDVLFFHSLRSTHVESEEMWSHFARGYCSVRALPARHAEALPIMRIIELLEHLSKGCATCPLRLGSESLDVFVQAKLSMLKRMAVGISEMTPYVS